MDQNTCVVEGQTFSAVDAESADACEGCYFQYRLVCSKKIGPCTSGARDDGRNIIWKPVLPPQPEVHLSFSLGQAVTCHLAGQVGISYDKLAELVNEALTNIAESAHEGDSIVLPGSVMFRFYWRPTK